MAAPTVLAATSSAGSEAEFFLFLVFYGLLGYAYAVWTRRSIGTTPWRLPAIAWGVVSAMLPMFGLLLEMVARLTTRHANSRPGAGPLGPFGRGGGLGGSGFGFGRPRGDGTDPIAGSGYGGPAPLRSDLEVPPANPAGGGSPWPTGVSTRPGPDGWRPMARNEAGDLLAPPLFGWYADPDDAHEQRYWDGRTWTEFVRNGAETSAAPLETWHATTPFTPAPSSGGGPPA